MASKSSHTTVDHDEIRNWIETRGGHPSTVEGTEHESEAGVLQIDFEANGKEPNLREIDWDTFFEKFDEKGLAFIYQDKTAAGEESRFFKFVSREHVDLDESPAPGVSEAEEIESRGEGPNLLEDPALVRRLNDVLDADLEVIDLFTEAAEQTRDDRLKDQLRAHCRTIEDQLLEVANLIYAYGGEPTSLPSPPDHGEPRSSLHH